MNKINKLAVIVAVGLLMSQTTALASNNKNVNTVKPPVTNNSISNKTLANLSSVAISSKSSVKLTDINILTQDDGNTLSYTLTFKNNDSKELSLIDYWTRVKTANGTTYSSNLMTKDKTKKNVAPQSELSVTYYAKVGSISNISDLNIEIVKWDFSVANYERKLGSFHVPSTVSASTPYGKAKSMKINDISVNAVIDSAYMYKAGEYNYVNIALRVRNTGLKVLEDPKYKFNIRTLNGGNYTLQLDAASVDYKIQPNDIKTLNLVARIPANTKLDKMQLQILQDDSTDKGVNSTIAVATFQLPNPKGQESTKNEMSFKVGDTTLLGSITNIWKNSNGDETQSTISINLRNTGNSTVTLPKYEFVVHTENGYSIPITTNALENVTLKPLEEKDIRLNVSLPSYMSSNNLSLFLNQPVDASQKDAVSFPVAVLNVPNVDPTSSSVGSSYYIQNSKGNFTLTLQSVQRLPWVDGDMVSAKINIKNDSLAKSIEIPKIGGSFKLDGVKGSGDSKMVQSSSSFIVGPGKDIDLYLTTKIPYDLEFSQLQVLLTEMIGEKANDLIQITNNGSLSKIPTVETGKTYKINTSGRNAEVKERRTLFYPGTGSNIIYTEIEVSSLEKRQTDLSHLVGFYTTSDKQYFKATMSQVGHSTRPDGKNIVVVWAKVPRGIDSNSLSLVLGEGISDDKMTPPKGEATGYVNAVQLGLSNSNINVSNSLTNLDMFPYNFSIRSLSGSLTGGSSVRVTFDYSLTRNDEYEIGEYQHKIIMELEDTSTGRIISKELTLETGELKIGANNTASLSFDSDIFEKVKTGSFKLNIYDQFQGQQIKLGSQGYYYSNTSEF